MEPITDCSGLPIPAYTAGKVTYSGMEEGAKPEGSVYLLKLDIKGSAAVMPAAGQFYMLRAMKTGVLLGRPVSIFHAEKKAQGVELQFLILVKGQGTAELCGLESDDEVQLLGPLGNTFPMPEKGTKVCIVGGGIGIAPVAGFSETLPDTSYDFFASYKSGRYGLENIHPSSLTVTTDDGSSGIHGMLPAALTTDTLRAGGYSAVYACGPAPMLSYVKKISEEAGIVCWISMESRMACGMGVCLGCTIPTTEGNKRCCKDGPVFDSRILTFPKPVSQPHKEPLTAEPDLSVTIAGVKFRNPVIGSSGTFGFGTEYTPLFDVNRLGGIASKGLTIEPREGNPGIRLWETPAGLMNSIGLQNPGIPHFIEHELHEMLKLEPVTIANLSGSTLETYVEGAKLLDKTDVPVIELNISCPNVAAGGASWGMTCANADTAVRAVRAVTAKPLIVKLTPQAPDLAGVILSCVKAGADAISLCNSFQGVAIDIERGVPVFDKIKAGFGGPAVRPIAVRLIWETVEAMNTLPEKERVPVIAIGGIEKWQDAVEFIMAGAAAVEVGTNTFANPLTMIEILDGLTAFMKRKGYATIDTMRGIAHKVLTA
jgi:dihydroorotate dehydrogenase subfamily 1